MGQMNSMAYRYDRPAPIKVNRKGRAKAVRDIYREVVREQKSEVRKRLKIEKDVSDTKRKPDSKGRRRKKDGRKVVRGPVYRTKVVNGIITHENDGRQKNG